MLFRGDKTMKIEILSESELSRVFGEERKCTACGETIVEQAADRDYLCIDCGKNILTVRA